MYIVGVAIIASSLVRLVYIHKFAAATNITWSYSYIDLWSNIEVYLSQICCCMPATIDLTRSIRNHFTTADDSSISIFGGFDGPSAEDVEKYEAASSYGSDSAMAPVIQRAGHQIRPKDSFPENSLRSAGRDAPPSSSTMYRDSHDGIQFEPPVHSQLSYEEILQHRRTYPVFREYRPQSLARLDSASTPRTVISKVAEDVVPTDTCLSSDVEFQSWPRALAEERMTVPRLNSDVLPSTVKGKRSKAPLGMFNEWSDGQGGASSGSTVPGGVF